MGYLPPPPPDFGTQAVFGPSVPPYGTYERYVHDLYGDRRPSRFAWLGYTAVGLVGTLVLLVAWAVFG